MYAEELFRDSDPIVKELAEFVMAKVRSFGPLKVELKKASLHVLNRAAFLGIHPRKHYLEINIVSDKPILDQRVLKSVQVSKGKYHNTVRLNDEAQLDRTFANMLREAYDLLADKE